MDSKTYTYQEVFDASMDYFGGDDLAASVFVDKYALRKADDEFVEKTPTDMHMRIAKELYRIELKYPDPMSIDEIFNLLDKFQYIIPQGSGMFGIGNPYQTVSLSNCYVLSQLEDSYNSILDVDKELVNISKRRGGCGISLTPLRPSGSSVTNAARSSTGIGPFMERYSNSTREVGQNNRRGALMITLNVKHPDIETFVDIKSNLNKVTGANISVQLTNEFLNAVENDEEFDLCFPVTSDNVYKTIRARDLWNKIIKNAHAMAEPGLLFWDRILSESPADCYAGEGFETISTNPCSELPLSALDSCRLMVMNLASMVQDPFTSDAYIDFALIHKTAMSLQRLMDDMIDLELEAIDKIISKIARDPETHESKRGEIQLWRKIRDNCERGRRTGSGVVGVADMLAAVGVPYGSEEGMKIIDEVFDVFKASCYNMSINLAKDRGCFPVFDFEKEKDNPFLNRMYDKHSSLREDMREHGRRNISLLTIAPTGSVSLLAQTSSGIEPVFQLEHIRRRKIDAKHSNNVRVDYIDQTGDSWQNYSVYHPMVKEWKEITGEDDLTKSPWYGSCANDIDWESRVRLQALINLHIDHSISSTVNLPKETTVETVEEIYKMAWKSGCKGITIYRDGCRSGVLLSSDHKDGKIVKTTAPKRPTILPCDVHHLTSRGRKYIVIVGLLHESPYETFVFENYTNDGDVYIPKHVTSGTTYKKRRGEYVLNYLHPKTGETDKYYLKDAMHDENLDMITRLLSAGLRHGADISFIVHQLEKSFGNIASFSKILARALKKYIEDGSHVSGEECPTCSSKLVRQEGCVICQSCGYSKCG